MPDERRYGNAQRTIRNKKVRMEDLMSNGSSLPPDASQRYPVNVKVIDRQ
jgi:hypothetical protein